MQIKSCDRGVSVAVTVMNLISESDEAMITLPVRAPTNYDRELLDHRSGYSDDNTVVNGGSLRRTSTDVAHIPNANTTLLARSFDA